MTKSLLAYWFNGNYESFKIIKTTVIQKSFSDMMFSLKQIITKFYRVDEHNRGNGYMRMDKDRKKTWKIEMAPSQW